MSHVGCESQNRLGCMESFFWKPNIYCVRMKTMKYNEHGCFQGFHSYPSVMLTPPLTFVLIFAFCHCCQRFLHICGTAQVPQQTMDMREAQRLKGPSNPWNETESNTESKTKSNVVSCHSKKVKQNLCEFRVLRVLGVGVFLVFRRIRLKRKNTEAVASLEEK